MEFCDDCGSIMHKEDDTWVCRSCGNESFRTSADQQMITTQSQQDEGVIDVSDAEDRGLPTTEVHCSNCGNDRAYWYMQQIRSADESETRFFICTECEHRWREDDN